MRIAATNLSFAYGGHTAGSAPTIIDQLSFTLNHGTTLALWGPSGCGKSTLLHLCAGLLTPSAGALTWNEARQPARLGAEIALLTQDYLLDLGLSAQANVQLPGCFGHPAITASAAAALLAEVQLSAWQDQPVSQLSGGQRLRVALARSIAMRPGAVLADEPTAALDADSARICGEAMIRLCRAHNTTCLIATHDHHLASLCDQTLDLTAPAQPAPGVET